MTVGSDNSVKAKLSVKRAGKYWFRIVGEDGTQMREANAHPMIVIADEYPTAQINLTSQDTEVGIDEAVEILSRRLPETVVARP